MLDIGARNMLSSLQFRNWVLLVPSDCTGAGMKPKTLKAGIFDVDGTLIDSVDFHAQV
jgi:hypothetical protein